jgi:hypothetical protein
MNTNCKINREGSVLIRVSKFHFFIHPNAVGPTLDHHFLCSIFINNSNTKVQLLIKSSKYIKFVNGN